MLLTGVSLALLVVYAGVKLLIQVKKESLSHLYKFAAWFFIIAGLLILLCGGISCVVKCCKYGAHMMKKGSHHDYYKQSWEHDKMKGYSCGCDGMQMCHCGSGNACHMGKMNMCAESCSRDSMHQHMHHMEMK